MATIIAAIIVFGIVALDVFYLIKRRMRGKSSCSCCDSCGSCTKCKDGEGKKQNCCH